MYVKENHYQPNKPPKYMQMYVCLHLKWNSIKSTTLNIFYSKTKATLPQLEMLTLCYLNNLNVKRKPTTGFSSCTL